MIDQFTFSDTILTMATSITPVILVVREVDGWAQVIKQISKSLFHHVPFNNEFSQKVFHFVLQM